MLTLSNPPAPAAPRPKAVVIGAGYGGLAAAIRLGAKGYAVTLLDRLDAPGGRATSHREGGYRFDLGPTIVTAPQVFRALWAEAGADFDADVDLRPLSPFYEIRFQDGSRFRASGDAEEMRAEVARLSPTTRRAMTGSWPMRASATRSASRISASGPCISSGSW